MKLLTPNQALSWIKNNKVFVALVIVVILLLPRTHTLPSSDQRQTLKFEQYAGESMAPQADMLSSNRVTTTNSYMSVLVKDVSDALSQITNYVQTNGGYVVTQNLTTPEFGKSGYITIRIANNFRDAFIQNMRDLSLRVVNENIDSQDITDEYIDVNERLTQMETTKTRLLAISEKAVSVEELVSVNRELTNIQQQIDSLKGQVRYLNESANTTLITINLSTDEIGLPYLPQEPWRPDVVVKQTIRSMLTIAQNLGSSIIVIAVWAVILVPLFFGTKFIINRLKALKLSRPTLKQKS